MTHIRNLSGLDRGKTQNEKWTTAGEQDGKPTAKPSSWMAALSKFGAGMLCLALFQVGSGYFPLTVRKGGVAQGEEYVFPLGCSTVLF